LRDRSRRDRTMASRPSDRLTGHRMSGPRTRSTGNGARPLFARFVRARLLRDRSRLDRTMPSRPNYAAATGQCRRDRTMPSRPDDRLTGHRMSGPRTRSTEMGPGPFSRASRTRSTEWGQAPFRALPSDTVHGNGARPLFARFTEMGPGPFSRASGASRVRPSDTVHGNGARPLFHSDTVHGNGARPLFHSLCFRALRSTATDECAVTGSVSRLSCVQGESRV
jgi:hypothetical protein